MIRGLANPNAALPTGRPSAVTIMNELAYTSNFVDTNFVWRGTDRWGLRGLRVNGGTTTGRAVRDECYTMLDGPNVRQHDGVTPSCNPYTRWETNLRGTAAYTIPKIDVLVSTVFARGVGPERSANHSFNKDQVTWESSSAARATQACPAGDTAGQVGCFTPQGTTITATGYTVNMLNPGELYGPGYTIFDLKVGKNIRFANKRLNIGVDIYNLFNNGPGADVPGQLRHRRQPGDAVRREMGTGDVAPESALRSSVDSSRLLRHQARSRRTSRSDARVDCGTACEGVSGSRTVMGPGFEAGLLRRGPFWRTIPPGGIRCYESRRSPAC